MKKLYYSIGEVSKITSIEPHVLRYWETIFDELKPRKNRAGNRTYRDEDITTILKLKELIQEKKYSTSGARNVINTRQNAGREKVYLPAEDRIYLKESLILLVELKESLYLH